MSLRLDEVVDMADDRAWNDPADPPPPLAPLAGLGEQCLHDRGGARCTARYVAYDLDFEHDRCVRGGVGPDSYGLVCAQGHRRAFHPVPPAPPRVVSVPDPTRCHQHDAPRPCERCADKSRRRRVQQRLLAGIVTCRACGADLAPDQPTQFCTDMCERAWRQPGGHPRKEVSTHGEEERPTAAEEGRRPGPERGPEEDGRGHADEARAAHAGRRPHGSTVRRRTEVLGQRAGSGRYPGTGPEKDVDTGAAG